MTSDTPKTFLRGMLGTEPTEVRVTLIERPENGLPWEIREEWRYPQKPDYLTYARSFPESLEDANSRIAEFRARLLRMGFEDFA